MDNITLIEAILGPLPFKIWIAAFFFFVLGALVYQYTKVKRGLKNNPDTPNKFDTKHYFTDGQNYGDFVISCISAYLFIRFGTQLLPAEFVGSVELLLLASVSLGLSWQFLADKLINKLTQK